MAANAVIGLLFEAWNDFDRVLSGLTDEELVRPAEGGSSFAWTLAHVTDDMDRWLNVRFQHLAPHPLIGQEQFHRGGSGRADDWPAIQAGVGEVRDQVRRYLQDRNDEALDLTIPYDGSLAPVRVHGLPLRYAILRNVAHHYVHIGEIATKRERLGQQAGDYPGLLAEALSN